MADEALTQTSNALFTVTLLTYIAAMVAYFFRLAFTRVSAAGVTTSTTTGRRVGLVATALAVNGFGVHVASVVLRGLAAGGRVPWGNMYEYSSMLALLAVGIGLVWVQRRMGYGHLMGFVLALAVLSMTSALLLYSDPGPLVPALESYWLKIHVTGMMTSSSILIVGFVATALYLVKDAAERRVTSGASFGPGTVGAAQAGSAIAVDGVEGRVGEADLDVQVASPFAQREALSPVWFPAVPFMVVALFTLLVWRSPLATLIAGSVAALLGTAAWYAVPYLPPAARLDNLAYRVIAFGFPILSFGVICGAIWAEESWGRYWGWDPKETGSFFTWTLYAAYLHARSTHGWRGRRAAWVAVAGFAALMVTYYAVNLWIVGLHSYADV